MNRTAATARIGTACNMGEVDSETQPHGLTTPFGFVSETGVAGLTLGGGFGYLTRRFGWSVDNLLEVEIVTADGLVVHASNQEHPELFWARRPCGEDPGALQTDHRFGPSRAHARARPALRAARAVHPPPTGEASPSSALSRAIPDPLNRATGIWPR